MSKSGIGSERAFFIHRKREGKNMVSSKLNRSPHLFSTIIILVVIFLVPIFSPHFCAAYELLIGTGKVDSFSYFAGKSICRVIKNHDAKIGCRPVPGEEYTDSLTNLQSGSLDLALVSSKMIYDAFHSAGFFRYITIDYDNLRLLMPLYRAPISLVVRSDAGVLGLDDLVGKRVNGGSLYSLQSQVFGELMRVKEWGKDSFPLFQNLSSVNAQDSLAFKAGSIQAMLHIGMHPDENLRRILTQSRSALLSIHDEDVKRMIESRVGFSDCTIAASTYPGLSTDLNTLAMETMLIASADTDDETVQLVLDAITGAKDQMQLAHPAFMHDTFGVETLNDSYLHPHPAAIFFFQVNRNRL